MYQVLAVGHTTQNYTKLIATCVYYLRHFMHQTCIMSVTMFRYDQHHCEAGYPSNMAVVLWCTRIKSCYLYNFSSDQLCRYKWSTFWLSMPGLLCDESANVNFHLSEFIIMVCVTMALKYKLNTKLVDRYVLLNVP